KLYTGLAADEHQEEKETEAKRILNTRPSLDLKAYTGKYSNEIYGDAEIVLQGDSLVLEFPNNLNVNLHHWNYDTFQGKYERDWYGKGFLQFSLDTEGKVSSFSFSGVAYNKKT